MKRYRKTLKGLNAMILLTIALSLTLFVSCRGGAKKDFNALLLELAGKDAVIDAADWQKIVTFLDSHKAKLDDFYDDGSIDEEDVREYITEFFANRRPAMEITFSGVGNECLAVKFYLERSGSMVPYDSPQGKGEFKKAIVDLLNALPGNADENTLYVVNDAVYNYPKGFRAFITDNNIFDSTKGIGDPQYTDFEVILDSVLNKTKDNEISILVTDMIYSTKNMSGVNTQKVFSEAEGMTHAVFKSEVKDKSLLVLKLSASYVGKYYPYNIPAGVDYNGQRPYYIVIVGQNKDIARLTTDDRYKDFRDFTKLPGFEEQYLFETSGVYKPYYSFLLSGTDLRGRFKAKKGSSERVVALEGVEADRNSGDLQLELAVNLDKMLIEEKYLTDPENYKIEAKSDVEIKEIRRITNSDDKGASAKFLEKATHIFVLKLKPAVRKDEIEIKLLNKFPQWINSSTSDDDTNTSAPGFSSTTFGLRYLMQGIYDCYKKNADGEPYYFEMELDIEE